MKRGFLSFLVFIAAIFCFSCKINAISGDGDSDAHNTGTCSRGSCWYNENDLGVRLTIVDNTGAIVSGTHSVDYFSLDTSNYIVKDVISKKNSMTINKRTYGVDYFTGYKKGDSRTTVSAVNLQGIKVTSSDLGNMNATQLEEMFFLAIMDKGIITQLLKDTGFLGTGKDYSQYYLFIEPIYIVSYSGRIKVGTGTNLVQNGIVNSGNTGLRQTFLYNAAFNLYLNRDINSMNLRKVTPTNSCNSSKLCFYYTNSSYPYRQPNGVDFINSMKNSENGYNLYVIDFSKYTKKISCPIKVNINECGNSTIFEPNSSKCVTNNSLYEEIGECNLYCSDEITTDFNSFYNTFVGSNKFSAIQSGKYISISGNPKITIKKTCYQSASSADCPNWQNSLTNKLKNDYRTNTITLNVDGDNNSGNITNGYTYALNGTPTINVNSSGATIVYEYRLDPNINKYISIATMRGVDAGSSNTVELISANGTIITKRASYGDSTYYLDLSNTVLNKYSVSGKKIEQTRNSTSSRITIFNNELNVNYRDTNDKDKSSYTSTNEANINTNDMYYACGYKKYSTGCICGENKCCDATTCKEVACSCECTSECGCKDDGKCTPLNCPPTTTSPICDPETETCFPNVVYRPISLTNPFPGINGNGRTPGTNWNKLVRNSDGTLLKYNGNTVTAYDYYIKYNRGYNDYEVYQTDPLYVIKLDPKTMKEIRNYNKAHENDYNDFDLSCQNGEKCISKFLRGQASGFGINLIDSGTCKDITASSFDSCISRKQ